MSLQQHTNAPKSLTVSQVTLKMKGLLETEFSEFWVHGELSGFKPSASGHYYFSLKDDHSLLNCALFKGSAYKLKCEPNDGTTDLAHGRMSVYPPRGSVQLIVDWMEPQGQGSLQLAFEMLKEKLSKEGLFNAERKKAIPEFPSKVVVITSPTGAALQDFLKVLTRRNSGISVLVIPVLVQGDQAPDQIKHAIELANLHNLGDLLVVTRGGGSLEDLWSFNDERVVRALANSKIPTVSAIGHEIDFTLCDFVADLRAPTPSAAAELISRNKVEVLSELKNLEKNLSSSLLRKISSLRTQLLAFEKEMTSPLDRLRLDQEKVRVFSDRLKRAIEDKLFILRQNVDEFADRSGLSIKQQFLLAEKQLGISSAQLDALSPLKVLARGYTVLREKKSDRVVDSVKKAKPGKVLSLHFYDGTAEAQILDSK